MHVKGHEVHSSLLPQGVSAVMQAAGLIEWANRRNGEVQARKPSPLAARFDPPFTTLHVGMISGGTAHNITAADCRFALEMRVVPDESIETWEKAFRDEVLRISRQMQAIRPEAGITLAPFFEVPGLAPETDGAAEALVRRLTGANAAGVVSYGTEAGQFQAAGYSAVVCGPGHIAQAHQPDEFLAVAEFAAGQRFMQGLLKELA